MCRLHHQKHSISINKNGALSLKLTDNHKSSLLEWVITREQRANFEGNQIFWDGTFFYGGGILFSRGQVVRVFSDI